VTLDHPIFARWPAQHPERIQLFSAPTPNGVKAGIMLEQLAAADARPRTLFENQDQSAQRERLMAAIDDINGKFGRMTVVPGSQGFKRSWKMRADMKSPAWTTRISDLPVVKA